MTLFREKKRTIQEVDKESAGTKGKCGKRKKKKNQRN